MWFSTSWFLPSRRVGSTLFFRHFPPRTDLHMWIKERENFDYSLLPPTSYLQCWDPPLQSWRVPRVKSTRENTSQREFAVFTHECLLAQLLLAVPLPANPAATSPQQGTWWSTRTPRSFARASPVNRYILGLNSRGTRAKRVAKDVLINRVLSTLSKLSRTAPTSSVVFLQRRLAKLTWAFPSLALSVR